MTDTLTRSETQFEVEQFLYREAWMLDERQLYAWLDLFADDGRYTMFVREKAQQRQHSPATNPMPTQLLFEDDKAFLGLRVKRLDTGMAHAEKPASLTRHLISNVHVAQDDGHELVARSCFQVYQARLEADDQVFYGKREDRLRRTHDGLRIVHRTTTLDHVSVPRTLTIFF